MTTTITAEGARTFIARQPIFDGTMTVEGYELAFSNGIDACFQARDPDYAACKVIAEGSMMNNLVELTRGKPAHINVPRGVLLSRIPELWPAESTVIELASDVVPGAEVRSICEELRKHDFGLAIDHLVADDPRLELLDLVDSLKIDFNTVGEDDAKRWIETLGSNKRLIATKVETQSVLARAKGLGYRHFQGFFFSEPVIIAARDIPAGKMQMMTVLQEAFRPEYDLDRIERAVKHDVGLSYRLLRYVNAAGTGVRHEVRSIRRALIMLGEKEVKRWITLLAMTVAAEDRPRELIVQALIRGRFCESLADVFGQKERKEELFLMGMLSLLDAVLGRPIEELIRPLPVAEDLKAALEGSSSPLQPLYRFCLAYERGEWEDTAGNLDGTEESEILERYLDAVRWSEYLLDVCRV